MGWDGGSWDFVAGLGRELRYGKVLEGEDCGMVWGGR